jgi:hypothetical protein
MQNKPSKPLGQSLGLVALLVMTSVTLIVAASRI